MVQLDASKSGGALIGTYVAQIICASLPYFWHIPVSDEVAASITGICVFLASHFFRNNGAKS